MNKAVQFIIAHGLFFAAAHVALKIIVNLIDGALVQFNAALAWTAIYWFFGGSLIGVIVWRARKK